VLEELSQLAAEGVEIFSCGTCLDYYNLKDKLRVGQVTNMYDTVETMQAATKCIVV
jgi:peroxiredoxin family protein